jgi:outer membrane protein TolC
MKKKVFLISLILLSHHYLSAQEITVESCQENARANFPLVKQYGLIEQTARFNLSNASKGYLPQLSLSARGTYQSQVTELPIKIPGMNIPALSKDQYQAVLEASQLIWDGGAISAQNKVTIASYELEKQKLEVDLFTLKERVNQLFFGILMLNEQIKQNGILKDELKTNYDRVVAYKKNGVANQSDLDAIKVEQLNAQQREAELRSNRKAYCQMLGVLTGRGINDPAGLTKPAITLSILQTSKNQRPELSFFDAQYKLYESQKAQIKTMDLPKIGLFVQGGYGKPGLNMLTNAFSEFYIGGVRLTWNFGGLYTRDNNFKKIEVNKRAVDLQKEIFVFNSDVKTKQEINEIEKLQTVIGNDDEIIQLRQNIKRSANVKLENGTITVSDLIREINAENQAKQMKSVHEIQLLMAIYQLKNETNN